METRAALAMLSALAYETRLAVLRLLVRAGPEGLSAGDLAAGLECRQNTLSSHLKQLAAAGVVDSRREGRHILYAANYQAIRELVLYLMEDCCGASREVCRPVAEALAAGGRGCRG